MKMRKMIFTPIYKALCYLGKPFGGIRPIVLYDILGRLANETPEYQWFRNRYGSELWLSPFYHIDRRILIFGAYDLDMHSVIDSKVKTGMTCFDIGANLGEVALHLASKVGPSGKVYAFEPVKGVYERLTLHVKHNNVNQIVETHQIALSNRSGIAEIGFADSLEDNQGLGSLVNQSNKHVTLHAEVLTMTIDEFVEQHRIRQIHFMKMDVQGAEMFILEGGKYTFSTLSPDLLLEVSPEDLRGVSKTSLDLLRAIEAYGYTINEIKNGKVGPVLDISKEGPSFAASNVFCTKQSLTIS